MNNIIIYDSKNQNNRREGYGISYKKDKSNEYKGEWENNYFLWIQKFSHIHFIGFENDFDSFRTFDLFRINIERIYLVS